MLPPARLIDRSRTSVFTWTCSAPAAGLVPSSEAAPPLAIPGVGTVAAAPVVGAVPVPVPGGAEAAAGDEPGGAVAAPGAPAGDRVVPEGTRSASELAAPGAPFAPALVLDSGPATGA